jgi:hypothetical protein
VHRGHLAGCAEGGEEDQGAPVSTAEGEEIGGANVAETSTEPADAEGSAVGTATFTDTDSGTQAPTRAIRPGRATSSRRAPTSEALMVVAKGEDLLEDDGTSLVIHETPDNLAHIPPLTGTHRDADGGGYPCSDNRRGAHLGGPIEHGKQPASSSSSTACRPPLSSSTLPSPSTARSTTCRRSDSGDGD